MIRLRQISRLHRNETIDTFAVQTDNTGIEIAAVCVASVFLFVIMIGCAVLIYFKRKQCRQRNKQTGAFIGIGKSISSTIDENGEFHHLPTERISAAAAEYSMYYVERNA